MKNDLLLLIIVGAMYFISIVLFGILVLREEFKPLYPSSKKLAKTQYTVSWWQSNYAQFLTEAQIRARLFIAVRQGLFLKEIIKIKDRSITIYYPIGEKEKEIFLENLEKTLDK